MLNFGNKEFRNLQGQVLLNANDIKALKRLQLGGVTIKDVVEDPNDLPAEIVPGDAYLVGSERPYTLYLGLRDEWFVLGNFPAEGPQGIPGIQGPKGEKGDLTKLTIGTNTPNGARKDDIHIKFDGDVYKYNGSAWVLEFSLRGPQGPIGLQGIQGPQGKEGAQGPQGERGQAAGAVVIKGVLDNISQLPNPDIVDRNSAYLIDGEIFIIVDSIGTLMWSNQGPFMQADQAVNVAFNDSYTFVKGATVQAVIQALDFQASFFDNKLEDKADKTDLDDKADIAGYYGTLHAGVADQLASPVPQIDTTPYIFRTSGGIADLGTGIAKIKSIRGETELDDTVFKNISVKQIKTVGFNLYNGSHAKVVAAQVGPGLNNGYKVSGTFSVVKFSTTVDGIQQVLIPDANGVVYPASNGYIFLIDSGPNACVSTVWSGWRVNDYEEYVEHVKDLNTKDLFPGGLHGVGNMYDEITDKVAIKRFKIVDLGDIEWRIKLDGNGNYQSSYSYANTPFNDLLAPATNMTVSTTTLADRYVADVYNSINTGTSSNLRIGINSTGKINIRDDSHEGMSNAQVQAALEGVFLLYAMKEANWVITPHSENLEYFVNDFGTEEFILYPGSLISPVKHQTAYLENLRDKLRRLPTVDEYASDMANKQDKLIDSEWIELTPNTTNWETTYCKIRKIGNVVNLIAKVKRLATGNASLLLVNTPSSSYRTNETIIIPVYNDTDATVQRCVVFHDKNEIWMNGAQNKTFYISITYFVD